MAEKPRQMQDDPEADVTELKGLAGVPGALKIITADLMPGVTEDDDLRNPSNFVLHDVVKITGPDDKGRYRAHSAEGDWTEGRPGALVRRLRQWREG